MRVEIDGLSSTIIVHPDDGKHSATVILMHGMRSCVSYSVCHINASSADCLIGLCASAEGFKFIAEKRNTALPYLILSFYSLILSLFSLVL